MALVLIVDDEPVNRRLLKRLLSGEGHQIVEASNGQEAIAKTLEVSPDLILMDVMMPGLDGLEATKILKAKEATRFTPVLMVTALETLEDKIRGLEAGADDFLTKPYNRFELLVRSRSLLKMKSLHDELAAAYQNLSHLNLYTDRLFGSFDAANFDFHDSLATFLDQALARGEEETHRPKAIFLAVGGVADQIKGHLYRRQDGRVVADPEEVLLPAESLVAYSDLGQDVAFANWQDSDLATEDYQNLFGSSLKAKIGRIRNYTSYCHGQVAIVAFNYGKKVGPYEAQVLRALAAHFGFLKTVADQAGEVERAFLYTIGALARAAEANDEDTGNHIARVNAYAAFIAEKLGQPKEFVRQIAYSAQMHDVGKVHIHPDILRKPGPLSRGEWLEIKRHTIYGAKILGDHPRLEMARQIALHHHEKYDGTGYPYGLRGEQIPLPGRIAILADVYDALRSPRSYKEAFSHQQAAQIILSGDARIRPSYFDPQVLEVFRSHTEAFQEIYASIHDPGQVKP